MQQLEHEVERVRQGDKDAFGTLIRAHEASLYRIAKSIVSSDEDCADAIQEAVLKAYRSIHTLREPRYFKTWLVRILVNECRSILRKRKQTVPFIELQHARAHEDDYVHIETQEIVDSLDEDLRIVVTLFYIEDLPLKEVADMLDQPIGTVKSRLYRARQKLAELLNVTNGSGKELTT